MPNFIRDSLSLAIVRGKDYDQFIFSPLFELIPENPLKSQIESHCWFLKNN